MPFWQSSTPANDLASPPKRDQAAQISEAQAGLTKARRHLLGAAVLLLGAFLLLPWVLDKQPRAWGDDVILHMPKAAVPIQKNQGAFSTAPTTQPPAPIDSTSPLKPSQPSPAEAAVEPSSPAAPLRAAP